MKVKPASKRGARQKTSTPKGVTRLNFNENNYGPAPEVTKLLIDSIGPVSYTHLDVYKRQLLRLAITGGDFNWI